MSGGVFAPLHLSCSLTIPTVFETGFIFAICLLSFVVALVAYTHFFYKSPDYSDSVSDETTKLINASSA